MNAFLKIGARLLLGNLAKLLLKQFWVYVVGGAKRQYSTYFLR